MSETPQNQASSTAGTRPAQGLVRDMLIGTQESPGRLGPLNICAILIGFFLCTAALSGMFLHVFYTPSAQPEYGPDGKPRPYFSYNHVYFGHPAPIEGLKNEAYLIFEHDSTFNFGSRNPTLWEAPSAAWLSVWRDIHAKQPYGAYIRNVHRHSTGALFIILPLYLTALLFEIAAGRRGIRGRYYVALALCVLLVCMGFSGSVLPWSASGNAGASVAASYIGGIPFVGEALGQMFSGGAYVSGATLKRMFSAHTLWLPVLILLLLAAVALFMRRETRPAETEGSRFLRSGRLTWLLLAFGVLMIPYAYWMHTRTIGAFALGAATVCLPIGLTLMLQRRENTVAIDNAVRVDTALRSIGTLIGFAAFVLLFAAATGSVETRAEIVPAGTPFPYVIVAAQSPAWYLEPLRLAGASAATPTGAISLILGGAALLLYPWLRGRRALEIPVRFLLIAMLALALLFLAIPLAFSPIAFGPNPYATIVHVVRTIPDAEAWMLPGFLSFLALVVALVCHGLNVLRPAEDSKI